MRAEPTITDRRHRRSLPSGVALARALAALLRRQRDAALAGLRQGRVVVPPVTEAEAEALLPYLVRYWQQGARDATGATHLSGRRRGVAAGHRGVLRTRGMSRYSRKDFGAAVLTAFDVFNPATLDVLRSMVFHFLTSMAATTADLLREALAESLQKGETGKDLQRRLVPVFGPARAFTVAQTESSRAAHAGQLQAAKDEGAATAKTWLASADACDRCLALDGKTVGLDEPFIVLPGGGPYAVVMHPGLHPRCMCAMTLEV